MDIEKSPTSVQNVALGSHAFNLPYVAIGIGNLRAPHFISL